MTTDPVQEAADALRLAQEACRAAWDACELAIQNLATARQLADGGRLDLSASSALRRMAGDVAAVEEPVEVGARSRSSGGTCEECDLIEGHAIWCSRRWGAD